MDAKPRRYTQKDVLTVSKARRISLNFADLITEAARETLAED